MIVNLRITVSEMVKCEVQLSNDESGASSDVWAGFARIMACGGLWSLP